MNRIWLVLLLVAGCRKSDTPSPAAPSGPKEKCRLAVRAKKGDRVGAFKTEALKGKMSMSSSAGDRSQNEVITKTLKYDDEVMAVDETGWPTEARRSITQWSAEVKPEGGEARKRTFPLEGRTVTLRRQDRETTVDGAETISGEELGMLQLRRPIFVAALPEGEVEEGTSWPLPEEDIRGEISDKIQGFDATPAMYGTCRLDRITSGAPRTATVSCDGRIDGTMMGGVKTSIEFSMTAEIDVEAARVLSMKGTVTTEMNGEGKQRGVSFRLTGRVLQRVENAFSYR